VAAADLWHFTPQQVWAMSARDWMMFAHVIDDRIAESRRR
jgi:hypothetical protein